MPFKTVEDIKSQQKYVAILKEELAKTQSASLPYSYYAKYPFSNKKVSDILLIGDNAKIPEPVRKEIIERCGKPKATGRCQKVTEGINFSLLKEGSATEGKFLAAMLGAGLPGKAFIVSGFSGVEESGSNGNGDGNGDGNGNGSDGISDLLLDDKEAERLKLQLAKISQSKPTDDLGSLKIETQEAELLKKALDRLSKPEPQEELESLQIDSNEAKRLQKILDGLSKPKKEKVDTSTLKLDPQEAKDLKKTLDKMSGVKTGVTVEHKQLAQNLVIRLKEKKEIDPTFYKATALLLTAALDVKKQQTSEDIDKQLLVIEKALDEWQAPVQNGPTPKLSPLQQKKKDNDTKQMVIEAEAELTVLRVGIILSPEIINIMSEHKGAIGSEKKAFDGVRFMDDIFAMKDETARGTKVKAIASTLAAVKDRRQRMADAINSNAGFETDGDIGNDFTKQDIEEAETMCRKFWDAMSIHVPEEFDLYLKERDFAERLKSLEETAGKTATERRQLIDAELNIPEKDKDEERKAFTDAIGHGSLKPAEMTAFYFDEPIIAITPEQQKKLYEANEKIIQRAYRVHDKGGSVADVEKSLAHIPEEFWPPQFIEDMQAWRKVEREMAEERVTEMFADPKKLTKLEMLSAFTGGAGLVGDCMSLIGGCSDLAKGVSMAMQYEDLQSMGLSKETIMDSKGWESLHDSGKLTDGQYDALKDYKDIRGPLEGPKTGGTDEQVGKDVRMVIEQVKDLTKGSNPFAKALSVDNLSIKEQLDAMTPEDIVMAIGKFASVIAKLKSIGAISGAGEAGAVFAKNFCPVLAAVASGMDMVAVAMQLKKVAEERQIALAQLKNADLDFFSGQDTDKAMVNALINEKGARNRQTTKKSVELTAKVITFTGDAIASGQMGDPTGATTATGAVLKIIGKAVELGNKVVFSGIDWSIAKKAMALLDEAQAGNPIARVEIFKDCGLYAKMYLCCAARDGSAVAKQYIIDRGLTEGDLTKPMALKVLREKLLKKSDQKDESKNTHLGGVMVEGLTSAETRNVGKRMVGAVTSGVKGGVNKVAKKVKEKFPGPMYEKGKWTPPGNPALTKEEWSTERKLAEENGLHLAKVGLGDALEKLSKADTQAQLALQESGGDMEQDKKRRAEAIAKAIEAAESVATLIGKLDPLTNGGAPYPEMIDYLANIRTAAGKKVTTWNDKLYTPEVGAKTTAWKPVASVDLSFAAWDKNWKEAMKMCMLSADDQKVGKRFQELGAAVKSPLRQSKNAAEVRAGNFAVCEALRILAEALSACSGEVGEFPPIVAYINQVIAVVIQQSQKLQSVLAKGKWSGSPSGKDAKTFFEPTAWKGIFDESVSQGFAAGDDQGMGEALKELAKAETALASAKDGEARGKARQQVIKNSVKAAKAIAKLRGKNTETHEDFSKLLDGLEKVAQERCMNARADFSKVAFTPVGTDLSKKNWDATYEAAYKAGAIPKDDDARKRVHDGLSAAAEAESKYMAEKKPDERFKLAAEYQKQLKAAGTAIQIVRHFPGFEHATMKSYCDSMDIWIKAKNDDADFKKVLIGEVDDSKFQPPSSFQWNHKSWTDIKDKAVKLGLMGAKQTGFGKLLEASDEAFRKWEKAQDDEKPNKRDAALQLLDQTAKIGESIHPKAAAGKLKKYMVLFDGEVKRRRDLLG